MADMKSHPKTYAVTLTDAEWTAVMAAITNELQLYAALENPKSDDHEVATTMTEALVELARARRLA